MLEAYHTFFINVEPWTPGSLSSSSTSNGLRNAEY